MTPFDAFADHCWNDHGADAAGVAARLAQALPLVREDADVARLATLAHHVFGEHLAEWSSGVAMLDRIEALAIAGPTGPPALRRCRASLSLCADAADERPTMTSSDAARVAAMAASSLALREPARAQSLLDEAVAVAADLADADPAVRTVAAFGHNIAATLQDERCADEPRRRLMIGAAEASRAHWQRAGGWREAERGEYRLAMCWRVAGDPGRALEHARACLRIVEAHGAEPFEVFFAAEAMALAAADLGDAALLECSRQRAEDAFARLGDDDRGGCRPALEALRAARPAAATVAAS